MDEFFGQVVENGWRTLQEIAYRIAQDTGWHDEERNFGELIALIHSEVSELLEAEREKEPPISQKIPEFLVVEEEAADIIIRVADLAGLKSWRVGEAILAKMEYNKTRPRKHNKRF